MQTVFHRVAGYSAALLRVSTYSVAIQRVRVFVKDAILLFRADSTAERADSTQYTADRTLL
jgi:hypothetical protein